MGDLPIGGTDTYTPPVILPSIFRGSAAVVGATTYAVVFGASLSDTDYDVSVEVADNINTWVTVKTVAGCTINFSAAYTGTVRWTVFYT